MRLSRTENRYKADCSLAGVSGFCGQGVFSITLGVEFVGGQSVFAARAGEFFRREEAQQQTLLPANRTVAAQCLRRNLGVHAERDRAQ
jgi:hypothetical protein